MSQTQTKTWNPPGNPSQPGTAQWLYDEIMRHIEPDLLTTRLPLHPEIYADETQEQRVARMKSYDRAFEIFDTVAAQFEQNFHGEIRNLRKVAHGQAVEKEGKEQAKDSADADTLLNDA